MPCGARYIGELCGSRPKSATSCTPSPAGGTPFITVVMVDRPGAGLSQTLLFLMAGYSDSADWLW